jgi:hypothetical protein
MEDSKKKPIMIAVIVVCLGVAGLIFYTRSSGGGGGIDSIPDDEMTWVKCNNPACKVEYEMGRKAYYKAVEERFDPRAMRADSGPPPLPCDKCGKPSVFDAEKCANPACGIVFLKGSVPNDFQDRCPECKQSAEEEKRKARQAEASRTG